MHNYTEKADNAKKPRNMFVTIIILVGFCGASLLIGYTLLGFIVNNRYISMINDIKGKGEVLYFSDIPIASVPEDENAAEYIKQANKIFISLQESVEAYADENYWILADDVYENFSLKAMRQNPERIQIVRDYLKQNEQCLDLLHKGLQCEKSNFNIDYENEQPEFISDIIEVDEMLKYSLDIAILDKNADDAVMILTDYIRRSIIAENEHMWISRLYIDALIQFALNDMAYARKHFVFADTQIETLMRELKKTEELRSLTDVLYSERCVAIKSFNDESSYRGAFFNWPEYIYHDTAKYLPISVFKIDALHYLEKINEIIELSKKPLHEIDSDLIELVEFIKNKNTFFYKYTKEMTRSLVESIYIEGFFRTLISIVRATLAVDLYKQRFGKLPEKLPQLVETGILDQIPRNRFTNKPLKYEIFGTDFRIYADDVQVVNDLLSSVDEKMIDDRIYWILPYENLQTQGNK